MRSNIPPAVRQLKSRWTRITHLERAEAVDALVKRGISRRALARELGHSEALLRHLQKGADLPEETRSKIRDGKISFRSAVRTISAKPSQVKRAQSTNASGGTAGTAASKVTMVLDAPACANLIVKFIREKFQFNGTDAAQVVRLALNRILKSGPRDEFDHLLIANPDIDQVISKCKPVAVRSELGQFDHATDWLARWSVCLIPRSVRVTAHKLAERQLVTPTK